MKAFLAVVSVALLFVQIHAAEEESKPADNDAEGIKVYKRLIPADVLRGTSIYTIRHNLRSVSFNIDAYVFRFCCVKSE